MDRTTTAAEHRVSIPAGDPAMTAFPTTALRLPRRAFALLLCAVSLGAAAADLKVGAPNAVKESIVEIAARFERETGHRVVFSWGGSESISRRVSEGEAFDVVVNTGPGVDRLAADGRLAAGSRTDFARSAVGVAVRAGLPRPDVSSVDGLRQALLSARSVAISSGASGRYLEQLFERLGVAEVVRGKLRQPPSGAQIGELLARGEADLGFQQVTELLHAKGIDYLGPLPAEVQNHTVWSAGLHVATPQADAARAFMKALAAPGSVPALRSTGLEPM
jgi:molybdate transport system substrate-binding protein